MRIVAACCLALLVLAPAASAQESEDYAAWPILRSTFPSTGGGGFVIKGYDPVITGGKCITTFMAVAPSSSGTSPDEPQVFANVVEFEAVPAQGGTLCRNGRWRAFEGGASGTTPLRLFFKDGVFRASPLPKM